MNTKVVPKEIMDKYPIGMIFEISPKIRQVIQVLNSIIRSKGYLIENNLAFREAFQEKRNTDPENEAKHQELHDVIQQEILNSLKEDTFSTVMDVALFFRSEHDLPPMISHMMGGGITDTIQKLVGVLTTADLLETGYLKYEEMGYVNLKMLDEGNGILALKVTGYDFSSLDEENDNG